MVRPPAVEKSRMRDELRPNAAAARTATPPPPPDFDYFARVPKSTPARPAPPAPLAPSPSGGPHATGSVAAPAGLSFKLLGIPIRLNLSFILVPFVVLYAPGRDLATIAMWIGLTTAAILIHELGHALAYKSIGMDAEVALLGIFGLTCSRSEKQPSPGEMAYVAAAGPVAGLVVACLCAALGATIRTSAPGGWLHVLLLVSLVMNLANLLPAFPLDGGRILKAVLEIAAPSWGATAAHAISLCVAGAALWWTMNHELEIMALILLGVAGMNFTLLRARRELPRPV